jgi:hypothetical protein
VTVKKRWMRGNPSYLGPLKYWLYLFTAFYKKKTAKRFLRKLKAKFFIASWHASFSSWHDLETKIMMEATGNFVARVFPNCGTFAGETMIMAGWFYDRDTMLPRTEDHGMIALPYIYPSHKFFTIFQLPLSKLCQKFPLIHPLPLKFILN